MNSNFETLRKWIPAMVLLIGVVAGYVQLTAAVKANSKAIEKQAAALEQITKLMLNDTRQDAEIGHLKAEVERIRCDLRDSMAAHE